MSEKKIVGILKKNNSGGLSITELVEFYKISRSAVRIILARLEGTGKVSLRRVGMAKLYYLLEKNER